MPIGDFYSVVCEKIVNRFICKLFGVLDLHTHIRLKPIVHFFKNLFSNKNQKEKPIQILDLGCGNGVNGFEIFKIARKRRIKINYIGVDISRDTIKFAKQVAQFYKREGINISFIQKDAIEFLEAERNLGINIILIIDILEHISNPQKLISLSRTHLTSDGVILVSVPTSLYPKFFGEKFHKKIGHLIDGYSEPSLNKLFNDLGFKLRKIQYNTGILSNIGCWLYYKIFDFDNKYFHIFKHLLIFPFIFLDVYNGSKVSCSLFAIYKKKKE